MLKYTGMIVLFVLSSVLISCTTVKRMEVPASKLSGDSALLNIVSPKLSSMLNVPLMASTVINISVYERAKRCKSPKELFSKQYLLGSARLTPSEFKQVVDIPSGDDLLVTASMERVVFFNIYRCSTAARFRPSAETAYTIEITPPDVFEFLPQCHLKVIENTAQGPVIPNSVAPLNKIGGVLGANLCSG